MASNIISPLRWKNARILRFLVGMLLILSLIGCNIGPNIDKASQKAVEAIDRAIKEISNNSSQWQYVLQKLVGELPGEINSTIRNEVQTLASRSIAEAGDEFSCRVDFLGNRAIQALGNVKAKLLGESPTKLTPMFCKLLPLTVDLNIDPVNWRSITLHGYDMDMVDDNGSLFGIVMLDPSGAVIGTIPEGKIYRHTHYQVSFAVDVQFAKTLMEYQVAKLAVSWSGKNQEFLETQGQVGVIPWERIRYTIPDHPSDCYEYTPPSTWGDRDFDTDDDDETDVRIIAEMKLSDNQQAIMSHVYLWAREREPDNTTVEGWSDWSSVYQAQPYIRIIYFSPSTTSVQDAVVTTHGDSQGKLYYDRPSGEVVTRFVTWIDRDGDEAGSYTRVYVCWRPITITVERFLPEWWE